MPLIVDLTQAAVQRIPQETVTYTSLPYLEQFAKTLGNRAAEKTDVGNWVDTKYAGSVSGFNTPYFDYVKFKYGMRSVGEYINCTISTSKNYRVATTYVSGRNNSVKQLVGDGHWDITFVINVFAKFSLDANTNQGSENQGLRTDTKNWYGNYLPYSDTKDLIVFFDDFIRTRDWDYIEVESRYLNEILGVKRIIPYSVNASQNHEITNMFSISMSAYSEEVEDTINDPFIEEIIPKNIIKA